MAMRKHISAYVAEFQAFQTFMDGPDLPDKRLTLLFPSDGKAKYFAQSLNRLRVLVRERDGASPWDSLNIRSAGCNVHIEAGGLRSQILDARFNNGDEAQISREIPAAVESEIAEDISNLARELGLEDEDLGL